MDPEYVRLKQLTGADKSPLHEVAGRADGLVNPTQDAANIMYKMLMRMVMTHTARMACVTVGIKTPYVISSRADPERSKIDSIALSCIYSNYLHTRQYVTARSGAVRPSYTDD